MTFDEFIENLVYSASMTVTIQNRPAPGALAWAGGLLCARYGEDTFRYLVLVSNFERQMRKLRDAIASARSRVT